MTTADPTPVEDPQPETEPEPAVDPAPEDVPAEVNPQPGDVEPTSSISVDPDKSISVQDGDVPGEGFVEQTVTIQAVQMNMGFDANGQPGNAGDWLVHSNGHWYILKEL